MTPDPSPNQPWPLPSLPPPREGTVESATDRCRRYLRVHQLPAVIEAESQRIVFRVDWVGAICMPAELGDQVRDALGVMRGPVVVHPRANRYTFLTGPHHTRVEVDLDIFPRMFRVFAAVVPQGGTVVLPSPADEANGFRAWIDPPEGTFLPPQHVVINAVQTCARRWQP